jgi:mono/diheme cytochrome c family protein
MNRLPLSAAALTCLFLAGLLAGCNNKSTDAPQQSNASGPAAQPEPVDETGPFAAGKKVFAANGCSRCHSRGGATGGPPMAGKGPMGRNKGPDLAKVGGEQGHTVDWFVAYVSNPKSQKPDSRMPPFGTKIQEIDLRALAEYLASLK